MLLVFVCVWNHFAEGCVISNYSFDYHIVSCFKTIFPSPKSPSNLPPTSAFRLYRSRRRDHREVGSVLLGDGVVGGLGQCQAVGNLGKVEKC